jgi:hypothetical protein
MHSLLCIYMTCNFILIIIQAADLLLEKTLSLTESLCGYDFVLTHMDGRHIRLTSRPGKVTKHEALQVGAHAIALPLLLLAAP